MEAKFSGYGDKPAEFLEHEKGKLPEFNEVQGGGKDVDPYGDGEAKKKDTIDMNAGIAFNKKFFTKIDVMGTDEPKKNNKGQKTEKDDHFKVSTDVDPFGTECAKPQSYQSDR